MKLLLCLVTLLLALLAIAQIAHAAPNQPPALALIATYDTGFGGSSAETISARGDHAMHANASADGVNIVLARCEDTRRLLRG